MGGWTSSLAVLASVVATALVVAPWLGRMPPRSDRDARLEGLRGVLALSVVAHHLLMVRTLAATGRWIGPPDDLGNLLGKAAVALFFMLSAYLFTRHIDAAGGRLVTGRFLSQRFARIVPAWLAAIALMLWIVPADTGFRLHEPAGQVVREVGTWLLFPDEKPTDINGRPMTYTLLSTVWSLRYEWLFYFSLPLLSVGYRRWGAWAPGLILGVLALFFDQWIFFALGALAVPARRLNLDWRPAAVAGLVAVLLLYRTPNDMPGALMLFPAFMVVTSGASGGWWLADRRLVVVGRVSYSLYLLHNPLIYLIMSMGVGRAAYGALDDARFIPIAAISTVIVLVVAALSYRWIELPFLRRRDGERPPAGAATPLAA